MQCLPDDFFSLVFNFTAYMMHRFSTFWVLIFILVCANAQAQVESKPDSTVRDYTSYDTTLPVNTFVDTVHHIVQDTTHHDLTEGLKKAREKAEVQKRWIKKQIEILSSHYMHGRGYVLGGRDSAAKYILKQFRQYKLKPVKPDGPWAQAFAFPVNTFPGKMFISVNGDSLTAGVDFLIDPSSPSYSGENLQVKVVDLNYIKDSMVWKQQMLTFTEGQVYLLENLDSFCTQVLHIRKSQFAATLPKGCYIIPENGKLTWSVSRETIAATVFYMDREIMPRKIRKITVKADALFQPRTRSENIVAQVPGEVADSYIVFSAHYDHLGMMGDTTYFPGASDNASGVAVLIYLAAYFAKHPQHYSMLFIAFAGEEASLMGSEFFVAHPMVPLKKIKFLNNIDIMGDATNGVTVVNATVFPQQFDLLQQLNNRDKYLPEIKSRGSAANSDHYYFSQAGVPSFFYYSNGGPGYYHDVLDRSRELSLNHVDDFAKMMIEFVKLIK